MTKLWVVTPVYNEQDSIDQVVLEWVAMLSQTVSDDFVFCILNDGSKDGTLAKLRALEQLHPQIRVIDKPNSGHGQSCVMGYRLGLEAGAEWIFQIDSDGQCDPVFFPALWKLHTEHPVVYGYRRIRQDGLIRFCISRVVSIVALIATGVWVFDANVPYRLMHRKTLEGLVPQIPSDFQIVNVLIAAVHQKRYGIRGVPIVFKQRYQGESVLKFASFVHFGFLLFRQLREFWNKANI